MLFLLLGTRSTPISIIHESVANARSLLAPRYHTACSAIVSSGRQFCNVCNPCKKPLKLFLISVWAPGFLTIICSFLIIMVVKSWCLGLLYNPIAHHKVAMLQALVVRMLQWHYTSSFFPINRYPYTAQVYSDDSLYSSSGAQLCTFRS